MVLTAMKQDHGLELTEKEAIQLQLEKLVEDHDRYVGYSKFGPKHHEFLTNSDELVTQVLDFFQDQMYTDDIINTLIRVTCDSLKVNINIYQQTKDLLQCIPMKTEPPAKDIYLKFTHNNLNLLGNHYDAIINSPNAGNLKLLSEVASQQKITIGTEHDGEVIVVYEDEDYYNIIRPHKWHIHKLNQVEKPESSDSPEIPKDIETPVKKFRLPRHRKRKILPNSSI